MQGTKLTFLARSHLAPKFSKVVAKAKKLGAIKKRIVEKTHYTVASNGRVEVNCLRNRKGHFTSQYTTYHLEDPRWRMSTCSVHSIRDDFL